MSELKNIISSMITQGVEGKSLVFKGRIVEYNDKTKECSIEISNPTGAGRILLENRKVPKTPDGIISCSPIIGSPVLMNAPLGNYTHAYIVALNPYGEDYTTPEEKGPKVQPRTSVVATTSGRLTQ